MDIVLQNAIKRKAITVKQGRKLRLADKHIRKGVRKNERKLLQFITSFDDNSCASSHCNMDMGNPVHGPLNHFFINSATTF